MLSVELQRIIDIISTHDEMNFLESTTEEKIVAFEKEHNIKLPMEHKKWLLFNDPRNTFTLENVDVDGYSFNIKLFFSNKRIDKIQLIPVNLGMKDPGYPNKEYQEEKKKVSDSFLRKHFGNPLKENEAVLYYEFDWGNVSSVAFLSGRNEYTGGFIEMVYKK